MIEYTVQPKGEGDYSVHKWDGGDMPITSYLVHAYNGKLTCNCPSGKFRHYCKHTNFVREYRRRERKQESVETLIMLSFKQEAT